MQIMTQGCAELGIHLTEEQEQQFTDYYHLLIEWNQKVNLTGITEYDDVIKKHFLDSLCLVKLSGFDQSKIKKIVDVGTGAGFPGIPLKIIFSDLEVTLLDSLNKRIKFLEALTEKLDLKNVQAIHGRAEDFGRDPAYREKFDLCVSRAVANLSVLAEYCMPLVRVGGSFVAYKSGKIQEELESSQNAIRLLGGKIQEKINFHVPESDMARTLISIKKEKNTSKKYPRKSGVPGKLPL